MTPHATNTTFRSSNPEIAAFTKACQQSAGADSHPRAKQILDSLMAHMHAFIDEVQLTPDEWFYACQALAKAGQVTDEKRNEFILISDVLGIESLVDTLAHDRARSAAKQRSANVTPSTASQGEAAAASTTEPTSSAILGPFFRENAPALPMGADIVKDHSITNENGKKGEVTFMHGIVTDVQGKPIEGAVIDVWHNSANTLYEQQDPSQPEYNCRGKFTTGADGKYSFLCLKPVAYPIPYDSTTGDILRALDRTCMRPGHIHLFIRTPGYEPLITQIFDRGCPHRGTDAVFAEKDDLVVDFKQADDNIEAQWQLEYNIRLTGSKGP